MVLNNQTIYSAKPIIDVDNGVIKIELSADGGSNWQEFTNNIEAAEEIDAKLISLVSPGEGAVTERGNLEKLVESVQERTGIDTVIADN